MAVMNANDNEIERVSKALQKRFNYLDMTRGSDQPAWRELAEAAIEIVLGPREPLASE